MVIPALPGYDKKKPEQDFTSVEEIATEIANAGENLEYWYADKEKKERALDIKFVKTNFPKTRFVEIEGIGHAGLATKKPQKMADICFAACFRRRFHSLSYFGIYRLMAEKLPRCAHNYRTGILGYMKFAKYFLLPTFVIFVIFFGIFCGTQIVAFAKGYTPYPKYGYIGGGVSGSQKALRKFRKIYRDVYRYYGVTQKDIETKSERYEDLVRTLTK